MLFGVIAVMTGGFGGAHESKSAEPDRDVEALLPCFAIKSRALARIDDVVLILNVS